MADLEALRAPFPTEDVKQRQGPGNQQLDYVPIETTLKRLLDLAPDYSWHANHDTRMSIDGKQYVSIVTGTLIIDGKAATGFGSMKHADADMAVKSANSEAMKNAAKNGFGVALELWDAEHRANLATDRAIMAGDPATIKKAVFDKAKEGLGKSKPTAVEVAEFYNVAPARLNDIDVLKTLLGA